jgi:hypothetical protein
MTLALLAAVLVATTTPRYDTVFLAGGGRIVGTVIEEGPQGIAVQLPDGTSRRLERREVSRIEYADGSVSTPSRPPPPPAYQPPPPTPGYGGPPAYRPPPPAYRPSPPVQPGPVPARGPGGMDPVVPLYGAIGIGASFLSGMVEHGLDADRVFDPQLDIVVEGGVRMSPHLALGLYVDVGVGSPARELRAWCDTLTTTCLASTGSVGVLLRHTFHPRAPSTPWISLGTGLEWGSVSAEDDIGHGRDVFTYTGWQALRLMGGIDVRSNPVLGVGLYGGVAFGRYRHYEDGGGRVDLGRQPFHTTVQGGLRFTLFP